jgi:hypothetical protein
MASGTRSQLKRFAERGSTVSRDKKVVWAFDDRVNFKALSQVQLLDIPGDVTKGEIRR